MKISAKILSAVGLSAVGVIGLAPSSALATTILAVGENRGAVYQLSYSGDPTVAANWSNTVSLYAPVSLNVNELLNSVVADASGNLYLSTFNTTTNRILKIDTGGSQTTLATENAGPAATAGWTNTGANGMAIGPDGKVYFGTAFGTGGTNGVFRLNTDGTGFEKFATNGIAGTNAERDVTFVGNNLWVTARQASTNLQAYDSTTGTLPATAIATGASGHSGAQSIALGNDGKLYVGHNSNGNGLVEQFDPTTSTSAAIYTGAVGTGPGNGLGMFLAPGATNTGGVLFSDYVGGTNASGQIRVADATATTVFSFNGLADPLSTTGGTLTGFKLDDLIVAPTPEPASLGLLGGAAMLLIRRQRRA